MRKILIYMFDLTYISSYPNSNSGELTVYDTFFNSFVRETYTRQREYAKTLNLGIYILQQKILSYLIF